MLIRRERKSCVKRRGGNGGLKTRICKQIRRVHSYRSAFGYLVACGYLVAVLERRGRYPVDVVLVKVGRIGNDAPAEIVKAVSRQKVVRRAVNVVASRSSEHGCCIVVICYSERYTCGFSAVFGNFYDFACVRSRSVFVFNGIISFGIGRFYEKPVFIFKGRGLSPRVSDGRQFSVRIVRISNCFSVGRRYLRDAVVGIILKSIHSAGPVVQRKNLPCVVVVICYCIAVIVRLRGNVQVLIKGFCIMRLSVRQNKSVIAVNGFVCKFEVGIRFAIICSRNGGRALVFAENEIVLRSVFIGINIRCVRFPGRRVGVIFDIVQIDLEVHFPAFSAFQFLCVKVCEKLFVVYNGTVVNMADRNGHSASGTDKIRMNECQIA